MLETLCAETHGYSFVVLLSDQDEIYDNEIYINILVILNDNGTTNKLCIQFGHVRKFSVRLETIVIL